VEIWASCRLVGLVFVLFVFVLIIIVVGGISRRGAAHVTVSICSMRPAHFCSKRL
jgi:hypothetical protein